MLDFLPTIISDPFEAYRPFPENPSNLFAAHWHEIVASAAFYFSIQVAVRPIATSILGKTYTSLQEKTRVDFDIHIVSMVQCIVSIVLTFYHFNNPHWQNRANDRVNSLIGSTPFGGMLGAVSAGYFIWDLWVCVKHFKMFGAGFLLHGAAALFGMICTLIPYCQPWTASFLAFELSTPFVNMNWFASHMPEGTFSDSFVMINGLILMVVFFFIRIIWGFYAIFQLAIDMTYSLDQINILIPAALLILNFGLDVLNVFWFYKMVRIARKKAAKRSLNKKGD
ncbi:hypothetical protein CANMA_003732 [Candida margitis]|uniref:uncharacterized protein n=1 Tax=Candida margitis TaxID=1775924 RepID=UPI0022262F60|nr:uncharacterized protein CANMA_003732 [Candida margitis]KAI5961755.1 hypothetical protein CANMA_003732 [Candida margitis]